ncbi:Rsp5p-dependent ubiquitination, sorting of cargo proteins at the multivesicular body [Mortierella hygrophila]|uniref:Rsp5p-dependent ubiquitination, sorting of cargo proteins at the multivesicular body n=1 Tax=Mortierella hygrophila TaxID=979708 RepID=A0A9P6K6X3_9FUNG|nr:Rsp5p-dependent ubiquitination, sorting of cargo proteins at the multivesicular body [Mortierella hygrophila]
MSPLLPPSSLSSARHKSPTYSPYRHQDKDSDYDNNDEDLFNRLEELAEQQARISEQLLLEEEERSYQKDSYEQVLDPQDTFNDVNSNNIDFDLDLDDNSGDHLFDYLSPDHHYNNPSSTFPPPRFVHTLTSSPFNPLPTPTLYPYENDRRPSSQSYPAASPSYYSNQHNPYEPNEQLPLSQSRYFPSPTTYPYHDWRPTTTYPPSYRQTSLASRNGYSNNFDPTFRDPFPGPYPTLTSTPQPTDPDRDGDDLDLTWLVAFVLTTAFIISIVSAIRTCGQKAGWLTGSSVSLSSSPASSSSPHHRRNGGTGRGGRRGFGNALLVPDSEVDPEATPDRLNSLSDADRQAYDAAEAFQVVNPPNSVPTDISLSQYLSIQEKGVSAWEFEPSYDHQLYVHDRTELSFFDRVASVQTNLPLPKQQEVYYWEVKMFEKSPRTTIAIGVATKPYPSTRLPGWNRHSAGYFSNNGQKYCNSLWSGVPFGPTYFEGDVVGCGYRPRNGTIFFTRNGKRIDDAFTGYGRTNLFPTVGATGPCVLHINFGQSGFVFVEANVKKWGLAPAAGSLAPPPAYGSELGSILLEAAGSGAAAAAGSGSGMLPQRFTSSSSSGSLAGTGRPIMQHSSPSRTRVSTAIGNGGADSPSPVPITAANMSAPPPNYSSLDRYGHPRTDQPSLVAQAQGLVDDDDTASIASDDSTESATLLLNDALLHHDIDDHQDV